MIGYWRTITVDLSHAGELGWEVTLLMDITLPFVCNVAI